MVKREEGRLIAVVGGSGFVGRHTVRALARRGFRVRAVVRRPDLAGHLQPMGSVGQIHAVQGNVRFPDSIARALEGADGVVNLVGILGKSGAQTFDTIHVAGARTVARAAREVGADRFVQVSAIGAAPSSAGQYGRTKAQGEVAVLEAFPEAIILRPSLIFGPEDSLFNRFAAMAQVAPVLPLVGGRTRFQPVYVGDVAAAIANICEGAGKPGTIYELGGPEVLTFRALLDRVQEHAGRQRGYLPLPFSIAKIMAALTAPLPNALRPLTVDQVRMLQVDNVVSEAAAKEGRTLQGLGVNGPHAIDTIVPGYLESYRPKGQYSHYRG
jgi:NADH dehydrogenase